MFYCSSCHILNQTTTCKKCSEKNLLQVKPDDLCFLVEKMAIWAKMFEEALINNSIPYLSEPIVSAAITARIGEINQVYRFYVPYAYYNEAVALLDSMFPNERR